MASSYSHAERLARGRSGNQSTASLHFEPWGPLPLIVDPWRNNDSDKWAKLGKEESR